MVYLSLYLSLSISCILSAHLFSAGLGPQPVPAICQAAQSHAGCLQAACERRGRRRRIEEEEEALSCHACGRSLAVVFELFIERGLADYLHAGGEEFPLCGPLHCLS